MRSTARQHGDAGRQTELNKGRAREGQMKQMYREVIEASALRNLDDTPHPAALFDVCRRHNLSYLGPR